MASDPHPSPLDPIWAWARYEPGAARPWNLERAAHLHRRACFGANWDQLERALANGPQPTIDRLLEATAEAATFNQTYDRFENGTESADTLRAWWLRRMIETPQPLLEKMTLFWKGFLAAGLTNGATAAVMGPHLRLLRANALGRLEPLLRGVCRDPAVLMSIQADENRKARPNSTWARTLLETFTVGAGQFSEKDVQETARALTGWFVVRGQTRYIAREHDEGVKKILGQPGNWGVDDVVRIVLAAPATSRHLVRKLYRWLISETDEPSEELVAPLAESFGLDYDVAKLVETMLRSNLFFSPVAYRRRVKSPVEYALGIVLGLEGLVPTLELGRDLASLGQDVLDPPTVKGWPAGPYWLNRLTVADRCNLAMRLLAGPGPYSGKLDPAAIARKHGREGGDGAVGLLVDLFLAGDVPAAVRRMLPAAAGQAGSSGDPAESARRLAYAIVTLPEYQLA